MRVTDEMVNKALDTLIEYGVLSMDTSIESDTAAARAALEAALSHAAGQDGEKCRAASVDVEALERNLVDAMKEIHRLDQARQRWIDRAVKMRRAYREQRDLLRALSRGVPEGNAVIPWRDEIDRMYVEGWAQSLRRIKDYRAYFIEHGYHPEYVAVRLERLLAAIAAQRKEG